MPDRTPPERRDTIDNAGFVDFLVDLGCLALFMFWTGVAVVIATTGA